MMELRIKARFWRCALFCLAGMLMLTSQNLYANDMNCGPWPLWQAYWSHFVQGDGRVIDHGEPAEPSYSEGQAYTLFFTLVTNDRARFDLILNWIQREMAQNDLSLHLPAWKWGQRSGNDWGVIDRNSASDADMWLAYTLMEAGRLWNAPGYQQLGKAVLRNIKQRELAALPGARAMLAPGAEGFAQADTWRFNPSYLPLQQLRFFAGKDQTGPWSNIADQTLRMLRAVSPHGFAPDWSAYHRQNGWTVDNTAGPAGGYDAIRVYLWTGMLNDKDRAKPALLNALSGMRNHLRFHPAPPLKVDTQTGKAEGEGPEGFSAGLLPYLKALNEDKLLEAQQQRVQAALKDGQVGSPPRYYDQVLTLFGQGWLEQRFSFQADGSLEPAWNKGCR